MQRLIRRLFLAAGVAGVLATGGCGESATVLNPAFVNYTRGGVVPLTPGEPSSFVLVRAVNRTQNPIEFIVTVEREVVVDSSADDAGTTIETSTFRLQTFPGGLTSEIGILLDCPTLRVGLGENLDFPLEEPGLFIGTTAGDIVTGYGVPGGVYPLDTLAGNYVCGDTLVFEARVEVGVPGNVRVFSFVLPAATQPTTFSGPDTFNNSRILLEREYAGEE